MIALMVGLLLVAFAVFAVLPAEWSLNWWDEAIEFLKGGVPILAVFIGLISFFVGTNLSLQGYNAFAPFGGQHADKNTDAAGAKDGSLDPTEVIERREFQSRQRDRDSFAAEFLCLTQ